MTSHPVSTGPERDPGSARLSDILATKLVALQAERTRVLTELTPPPDGDLADRATNVDAHARLALIERRIAAVEAELADSETRYGPGVAGRVDGERPAVALGDRLTLDFGEGPEEYVFAPVEVADSERRVITPSSPLGRALHGASAGSTVSYSTERGIMTARILAVAGH